MVRFKAALCALALVAIASSAVMVGSVESAEATLTPSSEEVLYKEYWIPHTQFSGGCSSPAVTSGYWYVEPSPCAKTLSFSLPDNVSGALRAEIYLDLWRNRDVPKLRFRLNEGLLRDPGVGTDWGRTPYVGAVPLTELRQGTNTIELSSTAPVHVHDIAIRVYHDSTHPLVGGAGSDVTPPTGGLVSVTASNGTFPAAAGGTLVVDNDQLSFSATASGAAYVDFIGSYDGYDVDADGITNEWQATGRNNWFPGGRSKQTTGGLINHLGSDATAPYAATWQLPHVKNQSGVRFKVRLVDAAGNVREAAGGISAAFTLARTDVVEYYTIAQFEDGVLHHDGAYPDDLVRTIDLPDMTNVVSARLVGNFWNNPFIQLNGNASFRAFGSGQDQWAVSNVVLPLAQIGAGANTIKYSYSGTGFGEFVEKPGPMIVLRRRNPSPQPPAISSQPSSVTVTDNLAATLRVTATGSPLLTYQWYRDGTAIPGATSAEYVTAPLGAEDAGSSFTVTVRNAYGVVTSSPIAVVVRPEAPWWNASWPYRFSTVVGAAGVTRTDKIVDVPVNFTDLLASIGEPGRFDPRSIRVIEVNGSGAVVDDNIPYQFDGVSGYDAASNARGTLVFMAAGTTPANAERYFHVYFAKVESAIPAFEQAFPLSVIDNVVDEGQSSFRIDTPAGSWYYHKQGAGFSSLVDPAGNDWLNYRANVSGSGGTFRGIPNMVYPDGQFHPGALGSTTTLMSAGPLKATLRSTTVDGQWIIQWEIYLTHARATVLRAPKPYWFLYEGTPGGSIQYSNDVVVRSNGVENTVGSSWQADITGDEWVYVADKAQNKALFISQDQPDNNIDSYRPMEGNMTVLGFGRRTNEPMLRATPSTFTVGLLGTAAYPAAKAVIEDRSKPLDVHTSLVQRAAGAVLPGAPTAVAAVAGDREVTVTWTPPTVTGGQSISGYVITPSGGRPPLQVGPETAATVTGLTNGQPYTFTVRAVTSGGTGPASEPSEPVTPSQNLGLVSDDFNSRTLRDDWTFTDPRQDSELLMTGNELVLRVEGGSSHDLFTGAVLAPQVLQPTADVDFQTVLKYENAPNRVFQMQGFLAKQDDANFVRFDMLYAPAPGYPNGVLKVTASSIIGGAGELRLEAYVPGGATRFLRVTRTGDTWRLEHSADGTSWTSAGQLEQTLAVSSVGVFAGNHAAIPANAPLFVSRLDYIFNTAYPIVPEDPIVDGQAVRASELVVSPSEQRFAVSLRTDQLASVIVDYGLTPAYEMGTSTATAIDTRHRVVVAGLQPSTRYYVRVRIADVRGTFAEIGDQSVTTLRAGLGGSVVDMWYGLRQSFGFLGQPQRWVNVLGNVADTDGIAVASFSLNGGTAEFLQIGADDRRLAGSGDFNVEIAATRLLRGLNVLTLTFIDMYGASTTQQVELIGEQGRTWPLPYEVRWDDVDNLQDVAQVVDGRWRIDDDGLRTVDVGYDRLVALGDLDWTDYEITVPITPHSKDDAGYAFPSSGPSIGLLMRWAGHYTEDGRQPRWGYDPLGALGWYRFGTNGTNKLVLSDGQGLNDVSAPLSFQMQFGSTYMFKMRVQTIASGGTPGHHYTLSVWEQGHPEQSGVTISSVQPLSGMQAGSVLLVAHHIDATFGDVSITRVNAATTPVISPAGGVYTAGQSVSIAAPAGSLVHYTLDGSEPTSSSKVYNGPFTVNVDATVKAIAVRPGIDTSGVASAAYLVRKPTPIVSDAFSTGALDHSVWTLLDPQDDALPFFSNTSTDSRLNLFVPAGRSHDLFDTRLLAPRLLQSAPNADFEIESKFQGVYSGTFTMQGLIAQQTMRDFIRVDVYRNGSQRRLYAGTFVNGVATPRIDVPVSIGTTASPDVYVRLKRAGNVFTVSWSPDGVAWTVAGTFTHAMVVTAVGPWVGAHSGTGLTSPAMTGIIDYFKNVAAPLVNEDGQRPANLAPAVNAGADLTSTVGASPSLLIRSNVADDQTPITQLVHTWRKVSGPGAIIFGATGFEASSVVKVGAAFELPGTYSIELCSSDGTLSGCDTLRVVVGAAPGTPVVDAGPAARVTVDKTAALTGTVTDDGLPGPLVTTWSQVSGPATATIANPASRQTTASFTERGVYVFKLSATDGAYSASDLVEVSVVDPRTTDGLLALYEFTEGDGSLIHDVSAVGVPLDLHISAPSRIVWGRTGMTITDEVQIASHEPATKISSAVAASNEYTVEAWVRPETLTQFGPARIVGISSSSTARNFTLGQGGADFQTGERLDLRTRSTGTSTNGTPGVATGDNVLGLGLNHIVATRDAAGVVTIWVNGVVVQTGTAAGDLSNWDTTMPLVLANEVGGGRAWLGEYHLVALYDRALGAAEVASHYQHGADIVVENLPPTVSAGADQTVMFPSQAALSGVITDDGRPTRVGILSRWSQVSGPAAATFVDPAKPATTASFPAPGSYVLRLTADDGELVTSDTVTVVVTPQPPNVAPTVDAGADLAAVVGSPRPLAGSFRDDGLPIPPGAVTVAWSQVSGPGAVTLTNAASTSATASFPAAGEYVLRLTANDGGATAHDDVTVTVVRPLRVDSGLLGLWNFKEGAGSVVHDVSGVGAPLDLAILEPDRVTWTDEGLRVNSATMIRSTTEATKLIDATKAANAFSLELWIDPREVAPAAQGRIASIAGNSNTWDVAIGQGFYDGYATDEFRARVGSTSTSQPFSVADVPNDALTHVVLTRTPTGQQTIFVNGVQQHTVKAPGALTNWASRFMYLANESGRNRPWLGDYQLVAYYGRGLTAAEITQNFLAGPVANARPMVGIGADMTIEVQRPVQLDAVVGDDGLPDPPSALTLQWRGVSGPAQPVFGAPTAASTTVRFPVAGTYVIALDASDGALTGTDQLTVTAVQNVAPQVDAGTGTTTTPGVGFALQGSVSDDGLPTPATLTSTWTLVSGPGTASIANPAAASTTATVSAAGTYQFRLSASDGALSSADTVTISAAQNAAPVVGAGADGSVPLNRTFDLQGSVGDDGLPVGATVASNWTVDSGPGAVTFGDPAARSTTARFDAAGRYVLRLTATDGALASFDTVTVDVTEVEAPAAPVLTPMGGTFTQSVVVTAETDVPGGVVHYTLDGSEPTSASPVLGNGVVVTASGTVRARVLAPGEPAGDIADAVFTVTASARVAPGLVSLYRFDEGGGNLVHDVAGVGQPLDLTIGATPGATWGLGSLGVTGGAFVASTGPASKISGPVSQSGAITLEAWVTPARASATAPSQPGHVVNLALAQNNRNIQLSQGFWPSEPDNVWDVRIRTTSSTTTTTSGATKVQPQQLTHVVYTRAANGAVRLYVNGVEAAAGGAAGTLTNWNQAMPLMLGNRPEGGGAWSGEYHLVGVYTRALSAAEVAQNFAAGADG